MMSVTINLYVSDHISMITGFFKLILITIIRRIIFKSSDLITIKIQNDLCILLLFIGNNVRLAVYNSVINCI
jgi:hypothetical protein